MKRKAAKRAKSAPSNFVVVSNRSYGKALKGTKIFFDAPRPGFVKKDGTLSLGKHLLEIFRAKYGTKFRWTITHDKTGIDVKYGIARINTSQKLIKRMQGALWDRTRDIKTELVRHFLEVNFPSDFGSTVATKVYVPGTLAQILATDVTTRLSDEDKDSLNKFLPAFVATESVGTVMKLNASAQIQTLKGLAADLQAELSRSHAESWWHQYIKANILLLQQGYIKKLDKVNVAIGGTKFPDFFLVTHDNYLDILEIKKPDTPLLKHDGGRDNYYWDAEMSKAIIQTENYIEQVSSKADAVRSYLRDHESIDVKAVRPRGIILAGNTAELALPKQKDDFRLLSQGIKSVSVVTYDELLTRLNNYIAVLEDYSKGSES